MRAAAALRMAIASRIRVVVPHYGCVRAYSITTIHMNECALVTSAKCCAKYANAAPNGSLSAARYEMWLMMIV